MIIAHLNINSFPNKKDDLISIINGKIDILVITETKLDETFTNVQVTIAGYSQPYRLDRDRHGGGVLIFVREDIPSRKLSKHTFPTDIEALYIEINLRKTKFLLIGTYHPPNQADQYYFDNINKALDMYSHSYNKVLLSGDFNAQEDETVISNFIYQNNLKNIVKEKKMLQESPKPDLH